MQKYYHKGAFYQDDEKIKETIEKHDLLQPTGFDKEVDMSLMPKVMQVKEFGMAGRTKCIIFIICSFLL